jgi:L-amino acid N-acyltransferase YncA
MQTMRESWTDERLDDGFDRVDAELRAIRVDIASLRVETKEGFERMEGKFERVDDKLDRWLRLMFSTLAGLAIALLAAVFSHM